MSVHVNCGQTWRAKWLLLPHLLKPAKTVKLQWRNFISCNSNTALKDGRMPHFACSACIWCELRLMAFLNTNRRLSSFLGTQRPLLRSPEWPGTQFLSESETTEFITCVLNPETILCSADWCVRWRCVSTFFTRISSACLILTDMRMFTFCQTWGVCGKTHAPHSLFSNFQKGSPKVSQIVLYFLMSWATLFSSKPCIPTQCMTLRDILLPVIGEHAGAMNDVWSNRMWVLETI